MKTLVKLEEVALVFLSIYLFSRLPFAWWVFPVFFFAPDLSLAGYLASKRIGALSYKLFHHRAAAVVAYLRGGLLALPFLSLVGVLLLGHASFDRVLGLGLQDASSPGLTPLKPTGQSV